MNDLPSGLKDSLLSTPLQRWSSAHISSLSCIVVIVIVPCHEPLAALAAQVPLTTRQFAVRAQAAVVVSGKLGR